jgi:hypothetical protein
MRVGPREGFAYHSLKLVLLAIDNRYKLNSSMFISGKALYQFKVLSCFNSDLFDTNLHPYSLFLMNSLILKSTVADLKPAGKKLFTFGNLI